MKTCYAIKLFHTCAILDLSENPFGEGLIINRINVPIRHRRRGIGTKLLKQVLHDADKEGVKLYLDINPYGEMTYTRLRKWYIKHGFIYTQGTFIREPRGLKNARGYLRTKRIPQSG